MKTTDIAQSSQPLLIPIELQSFVVNEQNKDTLLRWQMDYQGAVTTCGSPMPAPYSNKEENVGMGIYLHWTLPQALRQNYTDLLKNYPTIPYANSYFAIPNRWLVVRYAQQCTEGGVAANSPVRADAWIIESDFMGTDPQASGTSPFLLPNTSEATPTLIGRKFPLSTWNNSSKNKDMFLTAMGCGNPTFSAYQPYNENVLSIYDSLDSLENPKASYLLSYMVAGWYSNPDYDPLMLASESDMLDTLLSAFNWELQSPPSLTENIQSIFHGMSYGVKWNTTANITSNIPDPSNMNVSVGNTSVDALSSLLRKLEKSESVSEQEIDFQLLEAFTYNLLPKLDQPNGKTLLKLAIHKAWFSARQGGYQWVVEKAPESSSTGALKYPDNPITWNNNYLKPSWLDTLNQKQQLLDEKTAALSELQSRLYRLWWTQEQFRTNNIGQKGKNALEEVNITPESIGEEINSLSKQITAAQNAIVPLKQYVPNGATQEALKKSIQVFLQKNNIQKGYELKRYNKGEYFQSNDPVVLVSDNRENSPIKPLTQTKPLVCRLAAETVKGIEYLKQPITADSMQENIPVIEGLNKLPPVFSELVHEFFLLNPVHAALMLKTHQDAVSKPMVKKLAEQIVSLDGILKGGKAPDLSTKLWEQPWSPMFLVWSANYYPIPWEGELESQNPDQSLGNDDNNWLFDGKNYQLRKMKAIPEGEYPKFFTIGGITLLTPQLSYNFKASLNEYVKNHPSIDNSQLKAITNFINNTDHWNFLSQTLDGFNEQLISIDPRDGLTPAQEGGSKNLNALIGHYNSGMPVLGPFPESGKFNPASAFFQQIRSGQFQFANLDLVDQFGQSCNLIFTQEDNNTNLAVSPDMQTTQTLFQVDPSTLVQLKPRLMQPARLNFNFVSAYSDSQPIDLHNDTNPVCGWILPNHIDRSLACYSPSGEYLGEMRAFENKSVLWNSPPDSNNTLASISGKYPHLGQMLKNLKQYPNSAVAFNNLYEVIDQTLWGIDPLGGRNDKHLAMLAGRPLALARCSVSYQLMGPPSYNYSWQYVCSKYTPEFTNFMFPIRLGESNLRGDGLIGYFEKDDYSTFNCVSLPYDAIQHANNPYVKEIKKGNFIYKNFGKNNQELLTILFDPSAVVHATSSILPVATLTLPDKFIEPALKAMNLYFRVGPILSNSLPAMASDKDPVLIPKPAEKHGNWSWLNTFSDAAYPIKSPSQNAIFSEMQKELRSGYLKLSKALNLE